MVTTRADRAFTRSGDLAGVPGESASPRVRRKASSLYHYYSIQFVRYAQYNAAIGTFSLGVSHRKK